MPASSTLGAARRAIVAGALLVAAVLVTTAWTNFDGVRAASHDLAYAQGMTVIEALRRASVPDRHALAQGELEARLADGWDAGLRHLAIATRHPAAVGEPLGDTWPEGHPPQVRVDTIGERIRITAPLPPPHGGRPHDDPGGPPREGPPHAGGPHRPPSVVVEFEPLQTHALLERARRGLWLDVGVALALLVCACVAARWLRAREEEEAARARQQHLASLGEMSAVLAHELRNPLTALKGHAQLLAESLAGDPRAQRKAERVVKEALRIEELSRGLLEFVRTGALDRRPCDPAALLRAAADEVGAERIVIDVGDAPARWSLDAGRLQQVLVNLLHNALQASPAGAEVEARARVVGGALVFRVRDRGPGVAPEHAARIFEPFFTTRARGTGLGLAVARRIVGQHGGTIGVARAEGGGACFTVTLPGEG